MSDASLYHNDRGYTRFISRNRPFERALCSGCKTRLAFWLQSRGCYQRYWCDVCVKKTAAWKRL